MSEIDREGRERKLVALMLNDMGTELSAGNVEKLRSETTELSDEELSRILVRRLNLDEGAQSGELDDALEFVEEPEILSDEVDDLVSAPDLSHAEDADEST